MDRIDAMRLFTRVVEQRSFTRAAQDLNLPRSTVTDAIKQLEARLQVRLLQRTTRHVSPTLDGEAYYQRCLSILADIEEAEMAFAGAKPRGLLRIEVHGTLARHFLLPDLPDFGAIPGYRALYERRRSAGGRATGGHRLRGARRQTAGQRHGGAPPGELEEVTCAAPAYLQRFGTPQSSDDLRHHRMVGFRSSATGALMPLAFTVAGQAQPITLPATVSVSAAESRSPPPAPGWASFRCRVIICAAIWPTAACCRCCRIGLLRRCRSRCFIRATASSRRGCACFDWFSRVFAERNR